MNRVARGKKIYFSINHEPEKKMFNGYNLLRF